MSDAIDKQTPQRQRSGSVESSRDGDTVKRQRTKRGKGLRTRSGCVTCRTRRVKCDERKPICSACSRRGEDCAYPTDDTPPAQQRGAAIRGKPRAELAHPSKRICRDFLVQESSSIIASQKRTGEEQERHPAASTEPGAAPPSRSNSRLESDLNHRTQSGAGLDSHSATHNGATTALSTPRTWYQSLGLNIESDPESWQVWAASPESSWSNPPGYTAETASLLWFGLLANDAGTGSDSHNPSAGPTCMPSSETANAVVQSWAQSAAPEANDSSGRTTVPAFAEERISLEPDEINLFRHFVQVLSMWLDITDPEKSFAIVVADMALRNAGLMSAILALSARHLSVCSVRNDSSAAVKYYSQTLQYLQRAMQHAPYLTSNELLATVLVISAYEMLDTQGRDWERHLKGVFWIQRSQLIHGESEGLKRCIWWAWLRQDIWAAFKERRKILSFYVLKRPCSELGFWELVNRSVFLLGQCVNYASDKEIQSGATDIDARIVRGRTLWASLEEWNVCFAPFDRRLPTLSADQFPFKPIWINPPAASLAMQVYHFARLLLSELMPAIGGLAELTKRAQNVRDSVETICGVAYCTTESAAMLTSTQCLHAARPHLTASHEVDAVNELLLSHQKQTGWPNGDNHGDARQ